MFIIEILFNIPFLYHCYYCHPELFWDTGATGIDNYAFLGNRQCLRNFHAIESNEFIYLICFWTHALNFTSGFSFAILFVSLLPLASTYDKNVYPASVGEREFAGILVNGVQMDGFERLVILQVPCSG